MNAQTFDDQDIAKYRVLSDALGGRTALRLMHTASDIRKGDQKQLLPKLGSFDQALDYHQKDTNERSKLKFGFGKAGALPAEAAERLTEAIYDPLANKTELTAAFGNSGTFAPALATQGGSIIKDSAMKGYNDIIANISTQIGTRTDKTYWDGRLESTKLLWDIWILGIKDRMDIRTKDSEILKVTLAGNVPGHWRSTQINGEFMTLHEDIKQAAGSQFGSLPANSNFFYTDKCFTKFKIFLKNAIELNNSAVHWGLQFFVNARDEAALLAMLMALKERYPLTASKMYPIGRQNATDGRIGFDYAFVLILRTWRTKFDSLSIAFTSKYGPFDAIYRAMPSCTRRYWKNTSSMDPAELATMIDIEIQGQFGSAIDVPLSELGFWLIGSGFICTDTVKDAITDSKGTITPFKESENSSTQTDWLTMLYCKNTLAKWFWAKKTALEKISKDRVQKYLDQDKKDLNQIYYFLGAKPIVK